MKPRHKRIYAAMPTLAGSHFVLDLRMGNYIGPRGNLEYDRVYQEWAAREALRCARVGEIGMNSTERRWYEEYKRQNPI